MGRTTTAPSIIDYDAVFRRTVDRVHRICLAVLADPDDANDATMEVFRKLLTHPPARQDKLDGWLATAARTTAIDHLRTLSRHLPIDDAPELLVQEPSPEDLVLDDEAVRAIRQHLDRLSPAQRQVIELRLEGLSGDEIARLLGRKRNAVDQTAFRALKRLRELIAGDESTPRGSEEAR